MKFKLFYTFLLSWICIFMSAQQLTITGTVTDSKDGSPMPGVNVTIENTLQGTVTNIDGKFSIKSNSPEASLIFSFIGYTTKKVSIANQVEINVTLDEDVMSLDEVVVTGYGTSKKKDLTGSVATLKAEDLNKAAVTAEQMMQGRISGVRIVANNGEPGAGSQIKIRGASTIRSGQQPLYVVDGIPLDSKTTSPDGVTSAPATSPLTFLNPNDIESIDILKDASAAAIYGSRGANGVILITTKKGKEGTSEVNYSTTLSTSSLPKKLEVLSAEEFVAFRKDSLKTSDYNYGSATDWQDEIFRTAYSQDHNLALSGGTPKTAYRASFNYTDQQGIIKNSDMQRYSGRLNLTQKTFNDRLTLDANLTGSMVVENRVPVGAQGFEGDLLLNAMQANPTWPARDSLGNPFQSGSIAERSPSAILEYTNDKTRTTNLLGNISGNLEITSGLYYKINLGLDYANANRFINQSQKLDFIKGRLGDGQINNKELYNYLIEHTLNFNKTFGMHGINLLAGYSYQEFQEFRSKMQGGGYATDGILYTNTIGSGLASYTNISSGTDNYKMQSFFGRVNYNLMEKYLLTATLRADGSSKFGKNEKYGYFPSFALGWRVSEEEFIKNLEIFSNLKFRAGWGLIGNSEIGTKNSQYLYRPEASYIAIVGNKPVIGYSIARTPNYDITWESTSSSNIGLDFGFFRGRLSGTFDLFEKTTKDLLLEIPSPPGSPTASISTNVDECKIINKGLELSLTGVIFASKDFSWEVNGNMTLLDNVVKNLPVEKFETASAAGRGLTGAYAQIITNDQPMNVFYGLRIDSVDSRGRVYYLKGANKKDSLTYLGNPQANFTWSLTNNFKFHAFDFSFFIEGVHGNKIFNNTALILDKTNLKTAQNAVKYYTQDNIGVNSYTPKVSNRYIEDGSYVRLSNITLGYTHSFLPTYWVKKARIFVSGSNLFLLTDYKGYDPDVNSSRDMNGISSFGIDITNYPKARTYLIGMNFTF